MSELPERVAIREFRASDLNFVRSSWLKSASEFCQLPPGEDFFAVHWDVVMGLLGREHVRVFVACDRDDDDHIIGWACAEPRIAVFHWAYVKAPFRKLGVARELVTRALEGAKSGAITVTHATRSGLAEKLKARGWVCRPHLAFYLAPKGRTEAA